MKWLLLSLAISIAAFTLAVFVTPVHFRIQLTLNRRQTLTQVSLGIINGLIWFTAYKSHSIMRPDQTGQGERFVATLEELVSHPEKILEVLSSLIATLTKHRHRPQQDLPKDEELDLPRDEEGKVGTPRERFILPIARQIFKKGLDVVSLRVKIGFGTGDAATTGIAVGLIYSLLGTIIGVFSGRLRFVNSAPGITVVPCYGEVCVDLDLDSVVLLSPGEIVFRAVLGQD